MSVEKGDRPTLITVALLFLRLGFTAFGGPAAHISLMEDELVNRRRWLSHDQFLDLVGAANLIPGPNSTEIAIHVGQTQQGFLGLIISGLSFILPAALMVSGIAALYLQFGKLPAMTGIFYGLKPVIIAIVAQAVWNLAHTALKTRLLIMTSALVVILYLFGVSEIFLLFGSGLIASSIYFVQCKEKRESKFFQVLFASIACLIGFTQTLSLLTPIDLPYSSGALFLYFLKIGSVLYGSGYVLLAFLQSDLVEHYHWISAAQLLDATAVGQMTPGPVFTTATFIGYILGGPVGAALATTGIFLPAFIFVALSGPIVRRMRDSALTAQFLDGVNTSAIALMFVVMCQLAKSALIDPTTVAIAILSGILLVRFRVNSAWLMAAGAALGLFMHQSF